MILDKDQLNAWVVHIQGKPCAEIKSEIKKDAKGDIVGKQTDYENGVFVYENEAVFQKRAITWAQAKFAKSDFDDILEKYKKNELASSDTIKYIEDGKDLSEKISRLLTEFGFDHGFYEKTHTLPDGSVYMKLKDKWV